MRLRLTEAHIIADRLYPAGAIVEAPPDYIPTPSTEGLDDEGRAAVAEAALMVEVQVRGLDGRRKVLTLPRAMLPRADGHADDWVSHGPTFGKGRRHEARWR